MISPELLKMAGLYSVWTGQDGTCSVQLYIIVYGNFGMVLNCSDQGRTQDLSEGGTRFISEQKNPDLGTKRRAADANFFLR